VLLDGGLEEGSLGKEVEWAKLGNLRRAIGVPRSIFLKTKEDGSMSFFRVAVAVYECRYGCTAAEGYCVENEKLTHLHRSICATATTV
jgi:hypothetical protein